MYQERCLSHPFPEEVCERSWSSVHWTELQNQPAQPSWQHPRDSPMRYCGRHAGHHKTVLVRTVTSPPSPKHLRFLLGIGKLLSDIIPSFPAQANVFIYHRTHNLVYVLHLQAFLPGRFYSTNFSYICSLQDCWWVSKKRAWRKVGRDAIKLPPEIWRQRKDS